MILRFSKVHAALVLDASEHVGADLTPSGDSLRAFRIGVCVCVKAHKSLIVAHNLSSM